jgi:uncharacterized membrane protein
MRAINHLLTVAVVALGVASATSFAAETTIQKNENKGRPPAFARPALPDEVKNLFTKLETQRETFVTAQKELAKQWKDASTEEREALREKMRENRQNFKDTQRTLREDIRERLAGLRKDFVNNRDKVLDEAKEQTKERKGNRKGND